MTFAADFAKLEQIQARRKKVAEMKLARTHAQLRTLQEQDDSFAAQYLEVAQLREDNFARLVALTESPLHLRALPVNIAVAEAHFRQSNLWLDHQKLQLEEKIEKIREQLSTLRSDCTQAAKKKRKFEILSDQSLQAQLLLQEESEDDDVMEISGMMKGRTNVR